MPEAWYQVWCPGLTSMAEDQPPSCLVILKNSKSLLVLLLTLWPTWEVWDYFPWNYNSRQLQHQATLVTNWWICFTTLWQQCRNLSQTLQTTHTGFLPEESLLNTEDLKRTMDPKCCQCQSQILQYIHQKWSSWKCSFKFPLETSRLPTWQTLLHNSCTLVALGKSTGNLPFPQAWTFLKPVREWGRVGCVFHRRHIQSL